jgi:hypothetical protein
MSKERDLLKEALRFINYCNNTNGTGLAVRIKEELAKPEIKPLLEEQIMDFWKQSPYQSVIVLARLIEKHHGIS